MNTLKFLTLAIFAIFSISMTAQSVDDIINNYFENTGGIAAWSSLKGTKISAKVNQGGLEIPIEIVQLSDGRQYTKVSLQGMELMQGVFDGATSWSTNFQTMKAEKSDEETTENIKLNNNDFPDPFINYEEKGYTVELMGTETIEGAEAFKVKLVKEPLTIDGEQVEDVSYYFFDMEAFIPIALESTVRQGPAKGVVQQITFSDYQEVEGLYFPFSITQGQKGGQSQPIMIESIELNPQIDDSAFTFPEGE